MPGGAAAGDGLPTVARMYNLYQPYDPVAYRRAAASMAGFARRTLSMSLAVLMPEFRGRRLNACIR